MFNCVVQQFADLPLDKLQLLLLILVEKVTGCRSGELENKVPNCQWKAKALVDF
jgi:hypothetical protein